jgi:hypothetical protein
MRSPNPTRRHAWLLVVPPLLCAASDARAQEPVERCQAEEYRQFDFWLGEWEVRDTEGAVVGRNEIRSVSRGCGLLESWRGTAGGTGVSINAWDAARGKWTQRWVGDGAELWLEGGLQDGRMVLAGTTSRSTPDGDVLDRITWTPLSDGRVRQVWEISTDGGRTWRPIFDGLYSRVTDAMR